MLSQKFIEFIGSATLSYSPWTITMGPVSILFHLLSSFFSMRVMSCIRLPTNTLSWQVSGILWRQSETLGLLVTSSYLSGKIPVLLGMIFNAKSESVDNTLLCDGFFKATEPKINPANFKSLNSRYKVRASKPPMPWPIKKTGNPEYILKIVSMKVLQSLVMSAMSSRQPLSPSDLPCPLSSNPTKVQPLLAKCLAMLPQTPMQKPMVWKNTMTPLAFSAGYLQVASLIGFLS